MVDHFNLPTHSSDPPLCGAAARDPHLSLIYIHKHTVPQILGSSQTCNEGGSLEGQSRSCHVAFVHACTSTQNYTSAGEAGQEALWSVIKIWFRLLTHLLQLGFTFKRDTLISRCNFCLFFFNNKTIDSIKKYVMTTIIKYLNCYGNKNIHNSFNISVFLAFNTNYFHYTLQPKW